MRNIALGKSGENEAVDFLRKKGYRILERNWRLPKLGEIDIIAKDKDVICFVEVKTRKDSAHAEPYESVGRKKQFKLSCLALSFLKEKNLMHSPARLDIVSISDKGVCFFQNAFSLSEKFTY